MLFTSLWSVRMVKTCDLGLGNATLAPPEHFQDLGHSFSLYGPIRLTKLANKYKKANLGFFAKARCTTIPLTSKSQ